MWGLQANAKKLVAFCAVVQGQRIADPLGSVLSETEGGAQAR